MQIEPNKFKEYLFNRGYSETTIKGYTGDEKRLMATMDDNELTQDIVTKYVNKYRDGNARYKGFIQAYVHCYNPLGDNSLMIYKSLGKISHGDDEDKKDIKFKEKEVLDQLLAKLKPHNEQVYVMAKIYFETGLRAVELINLHIEPGRRGWGWNLNTGHIWGVGKMSRWFKVHFSKKTADLMLNWLQKCRDKERPFIFFKSDGSEYKNQYDKLIRTLKKYCDITPHQLRHSLGHYLRTEKHWDLEQIREKLRHKKIETTKIYAVATSEEIDKKEDEEVFDD